ncbi:LCP family protein [Streptomyces cavernae]|uniref:LCP family protein n=1 Tax=Streptomyces cavernae TaxID=2259034 RepID=UPI001EE3D051|nr:LCP family protein [Streptomyces cavernae]
MNDRYEGYGSGHYGSGQYGSDQYGSDQYELVGYDEFGQPVYRQAAPRQPSGQQEYGAHAQYGPHEPGRQPSGHQGPAGPQGPGGHQGPAGPQGPGGHQGYGYGHDPYGNDGRPPYAPDPRGGPHTGHQAPVPPYDTGRHQHASSYDTRNQHSAASYDTYAQTAYIPQQAPPGGRPTEHPAEHSAAGVPGQRSGAGPRAAATTPGSRATTTGPGRETTGAGAEPEARDYRTEQFAFVEEPDGDSEDVIDWLKFTENRTERREEAKRRARGRVTALVVVFALVAVTGVGYLWYAGKLPGLSAESRTTAGTPASGAQKRDVIVVHLHNTKKGGTSTVLLVDNSTTKRGATVLLPNALALTGDDGIRTTLAKSVDDDGSSGTREALDTVLGTDIQGTWRLDTPYLNNLVELVGNIEVDTDTNVPDPDAKKKGAAPLVSKGENQTLSGKTAVAYATYRAPGESENAQLERFGQVMQGVLRKMSSDASSATVTVQSLAQIIEPPLTDKDLGGFLAKLADLAKGGSYESVLLPVQSDGTLSGKTSDGVVRKILGGTAKSPEQGAAVRVGVRNSTGDKNATEQARVVLVNGGYTFLDAGTGSTAQAKSAITYTDDSDKQNAVEVAKTLGLPTSAVEKSARASNADVAVVLGQDYKAEGSGGSGGSGTSGG